MTATLLLVVATAVHAGFQLTVTALVYPALVRTGADDWATVHGAHSRRITPLVTVVYGLLVVAGVTSVAVGPGSAWTWVAVVASAVALLVTATSAAPLHGRLAATPDPRLLGRLLRVDRVRAVAALVGVLAATLAALA